MGETKDFAGWAKEQLENMAHDPALAEEISKEELNADIAQQLYHSRTQAGLNQKQLAEKCRTKQSVISRIEDDDYEGHSLALLHKIAWALDRKLVVKLIEKDAIIYVGHFPMLYASPSLGDSLGVSIFAGTGAMVTNYVRNYQIISGPTNPPATRGKA